MLTSRVRVRLFWPGRAGAAPLAWASDSPLQVRPVRPPMKPGKAPSRRCSGGTFTHCSAIGRGRVNFRARPRSLILVGPAVSTKSPRPAPSGGTDESPYGRFLAFSAARIIRPRQTDGLLGVVTGTSSTEHSQPIMR